MLRTFLLILCVSLLSVGMAQALDIFYPADGTYVVHSDFLIVKAGENVDALTLEIGGEVSDLLDISSEEYKKAFADFLIVQPSWETGKNTVKVAAYQGGKKVSEAKADFFFQSNLNEPPPEKFVRFTMHKPEAEALCAGCHNMDPTPAQLQVVGVENPCASCHKRMLDHENVHGPAGAWQCAYCHDAKSRPVRFAARQVNAALCKECHQDKADLFNQSEFVHGPVAAGLCNICHDSHASDFQAQIFSKINTLCLGCHEGIDQEPHAVSGMAGQRHPLSGVPDPSRPGQEMSCVGCHDPHAGKSPHLLAGNTSSRFALCQRCHRK